MAGVGDQGRPLGRRLNLVEVLGGQAGQGNDVVLPRTELAEAAGIAAGDGVLVDEWLETIAPGVYAAGDVAAAWHPLLRTRLRVAHWATALHQGPVAARAMLGLPTRYERLPSFFSDQYDVSMEYSGFATASDRMGRR